MYRFAERLSQPLRILRSHRTDTVKHGVGGGDWHSNSIAFSCILQEVTTRADVETTCHYALSLCIL